VLLSGGEALDVFCRRPPDNALHADIDIAPAPLDLAKFRAFTSTRLELKIAHDGHRASSTDGPLAEEVNGLCEGRVARKVHGVAGQFWSRLTATSALLSAQPET
jgi:hypothetical protein